MSGETFLDVPLQYSRHRGRHLIFPHPSLHSTDCFALYSEACRRPAALGSGASGGLMETMTSNPRVKCELCKMLQPKGSCTAHLHLPLRCIAVTVLDSGWRPGPTSHSQVAPGRGHSQDKLPNMFSGWSVLTGTRRTLDL